SVGGLECGRCRLAAGSMWRRLGRSAQTTPARGAADCPGNREGQQRRQNLWHLRLEGPPLRQGAGGRAALEEACGTCSLERCASSDGLLPLLPAIILNQLPRLAQLLSQHKCRLAQRARWKRQQPLAQRVAP